MRYFFSTGEPSGELVATLLAQELRKLDPGAEFEGIGDARMRDAGFTLYRSNAGWATLGVFAAIPRIPKMIAIGVATALHVARSNPDLVVLVDFGAFHVRLARLIRRFGYRGHILDIFPPGAWLDRERGARAVANVMTPVAAFTRQRDFYRRLGLPVHYFGHPLASQYALRQPRAAPAANAGIVGILPGSRPSELRHHLPVIVEAWKRIACDRPLARAIFAAADARARAEIERCCAQNGVERYSIVDGARAALHDCDAAWVASGTAVLETALLGIPCIAFYIVDARTAKYARRIFRGRFYTLPNLVLDDAVVPEMMQEDATPKRLAGAMEELLAAPSVQYDALLRLRRAVGPADALAQIAALGVHLATAPA